MAKFKIQFPIVERISTEGVVKEHEIHDGALVECIRCHKPFYANGETAIEGKHGNTYLVCTHCGYKGSTYYYARQKKGKIVA